MDRQYNYIPTELEKRQDESFAIIKEVIDNAMMEDYNSEIVTREALIAIASINSVLEKLIFDIFGIFKKANTTKEQEILSKVDTEAISDSIDVSKVVSVIG